MKEITMRKLISLVAAIVATTMFLITDVYAAMNQYKAGDIIIENPWARATMSGAQTAAAFLTIKNNGNTPDRIVAVQSPISQKTEIHQSFMEGEMMKMRPVGALELAPGEVTMLKPGSYHVMFMGLKFPLTVGETFPLRVKFEKSGEVEVIVKIMKAGARGGMNMDNMNHAN